MTASEKCLLNLSIESNSVDPDQTAPTGEVWYGSTLYVYEAPSIFSGR